jgi:Protein kinase domain
MAMQNALPDRLGPYRLLERIGEGGMGVVYRAADAQNRLAAVKVLRANVAGDATARRRLAREVDTMRLVRSPFVAEVVSADVTGDVPYVATRYVPGHTLEQVVSEQGPLGGQQLQRLATGLAAALTAVHAAGVVHRDLKPGNVMLVDGAPVVIDFGIARAGDTTRLTQSGMFMGTPAYLAPEVIEGGPCGPSSDVQSWGATVAFAATGRPPFGTGAYEAVFYRILQAQPDLAGIPEPLRQLVIAAMSRDPAQRPPAQWLASQAARLDLSPAGVAAAAATAAGMASSARAAAASTAAASTAAAGAAPVGFPSWPDTGVPGGTRRMPGGPGTGPVEASTAHGEATRIRPERYADLLPPVRYPPAGPSAPPPGAAAPPVAPGRGGDDADRSRWAARPHRLLNLAVLAVGCSLAAMLPVAGTVSALIAITLLRAGDRAFGGLVVRRSARGARPTDALQLVLHAPWALVRSLVTTLVVLPFGLFAAAIAAVVVSLWQSNASLTDGGSYAAAILVAIAGLGPGSSGARRQLTRVFNATIQGPMSTALTMVTVTALTVTAVAGALTQFPVYWPAPNPASLLHVFHLPNTGNLLHFLLGQPGRGVRAPGSGLPRL